MTNWLSQIASVTWFGLCTIPRRKGSAIAAAFGIAALFWINAFMLGAGSLLVRPAGKGKDEG